MLMMRNPVTVFVKYLSASMRQQLLIATYVLRVFLGNILHFEVWELVTIYSY